MSEGPSSTDMANDLGPFNPLILLPHYSERSHAYVLMESIDDAYPPYSSPPGGSKVHFMSHEHRNISGFE